MYSLLLLGTLFSVIHSTDAGVDDFATTAVIAAAKERNLETFDFPAIVITNADCEPVSALSAYLKTAQFFKLDTEVGLSASRVWTQFPWKWRMESKQVDAMSCLRAFPIAPDFTPKEGNLLFVEGLRRSKTTKIIATGPLTTIADVLERHPELIAKVSELHWMGGAVDIEGNIWYSPEIPQELLNGQAEWNVFCDPQAADWVFRNTEFPIYVYPLDISDQTVPNDFIRVLQRKKRTPYTLYMEECYRIVEKVVDYKMWDVVSAAGVLFPEVLEPAVKERLRIGLTEKDQGAFIKDPAGREVFVYKDFKNGNVNYFYEAVANLLWDSE